MMRSNMFQCDSCLFRRACSATPLLLVGNCRFRHVCYFSISPMFEVGPLRKCMPLETIIGPLKEAQMLRSCTRWSFYGCRFDADMLNHTSSSLHTQRTSLCTRQ